MNCEECGKDEFECDCIMTMEEAQASYDAAIPIPMTEAEIRKIVDWVMNESAMQLMMPKASVLMVVDAFLWVVRRMAG